MPSNEHVSFANTQAILRFLNSLIPLFKRELGDDFHRGLVGEFMEGILGHGLPETASNNSLNHIPSESDQAVTKLVRNKRHARYVKLLSRLGISRKASVRFLRDNSPTDNRFVTSTLPANATKEELDAHSAEALDELLQITLGSMRCMTKDVISSSRDRQPGYWNLFTELGWRCDAIPINASELHLLEMDHGGVKAVVYDLALRQSPFIDKAKWSAQTTNTLGNLVKLHTMLGVEDIISLYDQPRSIGVGDTYYTTIGLIYNDGEWSDFFINRDCTSYSKLIELNERVTADPSCLNLLADEGLQIMQLFINGLNDIGPLTPEIIKNSFPVNSGKWCTATITKVHDVV